MGKIEFDKTGYGFSDVTVRLDGKVVGEIRKVTDGWQYFPRGQRKGGVVFPTLDAVKKDIIGDDN